jgi:hypothetical protein
LSWSIDFGQFIEIQEVRNVQKRSKHRSSCTDRNFDAVPVHRVQRINRDAWHDRSSVVDIPTAFVISLFGVLFVVFALVAIYRTAPRNSASHGAQIVTGPVAPHAVQAPANNGRGWERVREIDVLEDATANVAAAVRELETAVEIASAAVDGRFAGDVIGEVTARFNAATDSLRRAHAGLVMARAGGRESAPADIETIYGKVSGNGNEHT